MASLGQVFTPGRCPGAESVVDQSGATGGSSSHRRQWSPGGGGHIPEGGSQKRRSPHQVWETEPGRKVTGWSSIPRLSLDTTPGAGTHSGAGRVPASIPCALTSVCVPGTAWPQPWPQGSGRPCSPLPSLRVQEALPLTSAHTPPAMQLGLLLPKASTGASSLRNDHPCDFPPSSMGPEELLKGSAWAHHTPRPRTPGHITRQDQGPRPSGVSFWGWVQPWPPGCEPSWVGLPLLSPAGPQLLGKDPVIT